MVEVRFVSTSREDHNAKIVVGVESVNMEDKDQVALYAIPLDTLLGSYKAAFILP